MANTLASAGDLGDMEGAPFADSVVDSAAAEVRAAAGWHIAPEVDETLTVDSHGGTTLILPSLMVTAIAEVRHVPTTGDPVVITDYLRRVKSTVLYRHCGWPCGVIEVDVTHGYSDTPADLLPALADVARGRKLKSWVKGPFGETYDSTTAAGSALNRYKLPPRP